MTAEETKLEEEKAKILSKLNASKEVTVCDDTDNWRDAFDLFHRATGIKMRASDRCSKCFQMVLDFLQNAE